MIRISKIATNNRLNKRCLGLTIRMVGPHPDIAGQAIRPAKAYSFEMNAKGFQTEDNLRLVRNSSSRYNGCTASTRC